MRTRSSPCPRIRSERHLSLLGKRLPRRNSNKGTPLTYIPIHCEGLAVCSPRIARHRHPCHELAANRNPVPAMETMSAREFAKASPKPTYAIAMPNRFNVQHPKPLVLSRPQPSMYPPCHAAEDTSPATARLLHVVNRCSKHLCVCCAGCGGVIFPFRKGWSGSGGGFFVHHHNTP